MTIRTITDLRNSPAKPDDLWREPDRQLAIRAFVESYQGSNPFLRDLQRSLKEWGRLTLRQMIAAERNMPNSPIAPPEIPAVVTPAVASGTYTIVGPKGGHRTLRLKPADPEKFKDHPKNTQILGYLHGPDNSSDYVGVAFVYGATIRYFRRFSAPDLIPDIKAAARFLLTHPEQIGEAGRQYALRSGNCYRCNRKLTRPESVHTGLGPDCAEELGIPWDRPTITNVSHTDLSDKATLDAAYAAKFGSN